MKASLIQVPGKDWTQIDKNLPIVMAFSGGADSLALAHWLKTHKYNMHLAHLNHQIRPDANADEAAAKALAKSWQVPISLERVDVPAYAHENCLSLEEAARKIRYEFLFQTAQALKAQAVITAHHADDQVESVLMHFLRGSGMTGMRGMSVWALPNAFSKTIPLVRPLLFTWKSEILAYLAEDNLIAREDTTNSDSSYKRNLIRNEILPYLETQYPQVKEIIFRNSRVIGLEADWLESLTAEAMDTLEVERQDHGLSFDQQRMLAQPEAAQLALLRKLVATVLPQQRDFAFESALRAKDFLQNPTRSASIELEQGLVMRLHRGRAFIFTEGQDIAFSSHALKLAEELTIYLDKPGQKIPLAQGDEIRLEILDNHKIEKQAGWGDPGHAFLALEDLELPLTLRNRKPGDKYQPLGMQQGQIKLSDYFINEGLVRENRSNWPILFDARSMVWLPGFVIDERVKVKKTTQKVLHLWVVCNTSQ